MRLGNKLIKKSKHEAKFKSQPKIFKPDIIKRIKNH